MSTVPQPPRIHIQEVAPRDGLQNEAQFVSTQNKIDLINRLGACGLAKIEATSFTSPKAIPSLADAEAVMAGINRVPGVIYTVLVPNLRGAERALRCGVDEINLVMSVSEAHNASNLRMSCGESFGQLRQALQWAQPAGVAINVSLSCAMGCPFTGDVCASTVLGWARRFIELGVDGITLCDTTGMAYPAQVGALCADAQALSQALGRSDLAWTLHFHNTRGLALANALAALQVGITRFDASLGGLGGCPFAPGATGNVCTEDLVHLLHCQGHDTGVDWDRLLDTAALLPAWVGHPVPSQTLAAGPRLRRHALPELDASGKPRQTVACALA